MFAKYSKEQKVFLSSDWHFGHDRQFIWGPRGFTSIEEHNTELIRRHNEVVGPDDEVYVLGDLMLGDNEAGLAAIAQLNGRLHVVCGNHDTDARIEAYENLSNVVEVCTAARFKWGKWEFFCTHWPSKVNNFEERRKFYNIHGHTHSFDKFQFIKDCSYNVSMEAHNCYPVNIQKIIEDLKTVLDKSGQFSL